MHDNSSTENVLGNPELAPIIDMTENWMINIGESEVSSIGRACRSIYHSLPICNL